MPYPFLSSLAIFLPSSFRLLVFRDRCRAQFARDSNDRLSISIRNSRTPLCNLPLAGVTTSAPEGEPSFPPRHFVPHPPLVTHTRSIDRSSNLPVYYIHACAAGIPTDYPPLYPSFSHLIYVTTE